MGGGGPPQRSYLQKASSSLTGSFLVDGPKASAFKASARQGTAASLSLVAPAYRGACYSWGEAKHVLSLQASSPMSVTSEAVRIGAGQPATFMVAGAGL